MINTTSTISLCYRCLTSMSCVVRVHAYMACLPQERFSVPITRVIYDVEGDANGAILLKHALFVYYVLCSWFFQRLQRKCPSGVLNEPVKKPYQRTHRHHEIPVRENVGTLYYFMHNLLFVIRRRCDTRLLAAEVYIHIIVNTEKDININIHNWYCRRKRCLDRNI